MKITEQTEDRLRGILQATCGLVGAVFRSAKVLLLSFTVTWASFTIAALYMADPETTTFRDFLLGIQNPAITNSVFIAAILLSGMLFLFGAARKKSCGEIRAATAKGAVGFASDAKTKQ